MSEVLEHFVEPLADSVEGYDEYKELISIAVIAWNAALEPEYRRTALIGSTIDSVVKDLQYRLTCRELIERLVARKLEHFAQYRRPILAFQLDVFEDGSFYLSVASTILC